MKKIKTGDLVVVLTGRDKGRTGKVLREGKKADRVFVEGINMVKKHMKPNPQKNQQGGIIDIESTIHVSNLALVNPTTNKADRVGFKHLEAEGDAKPRKVRYFKSNDEIVDV
jgi:large subunit ribosomal protein L24